MLVPAVEETKTLLRGAPFEGFAIAALVHESVRDTYWYFVPKAEFTRLRAHPATRLVTLSES
ncbi:MAG: hypothetical protein M5R36_13780 [Deltaproteobacteria bacterium]|nr:hypothetical protein [Deltaproteobacteria bacterium]